MDKRTVAGNVFCVSLAGGIAAMIGATAVPDSPFFQALTSLGLLGCFGGLAGLLFLYVSAPEETVADAPNEKSGVSLPLKGPTQDRQRDNSLLPENITAEFLIDLCRDKTDVQAEGEVSLYIGKRLRISGQLFAATKLMNQTSASIYLAPEGSSPTAYLLFKRDQDRVAVLRKGDILSAAGTIFGIDGSEIRLRDCRLVD